MDTILRLLLIHAWSKSLAQIVRAKFPAGSPDHLSYLPFATKMSRERQTQKYTGVVERVAERYVPD